MTAAAIDIAFAPLAEHHWPLLERWLRAPHMREWWGDPDIELAMIRDMIEGRDTTRPFIFSVDDRPLGYIQFWFVADALCEPWLTEAPWLTKLPPGAIGVDLSIGEPERVGRGLGSAVLARFVDSLRAEGHDTIIIDPDPRNHRAVRAYEKAGFRAAPEYSDPTGACLIMRHDPSRSL